MIAAVVVGGVAIFGGSGTVLAPRSAPSSSTRSTVPSWSSTSPRTGRCARRVRSSLAAIAFDRLIRSASHRPPHSKERQCLKSAAPAHRPAIARRARPWESMLVLLLVGTILSASPSRRPSGARTRSSTPGSTSARSRSWRCRHADRDHGRDRPLDRLDAGSPGVVMAELFKHGWSIWPAMVAALLLGAVCGAFNGFLVTARPAVARGDIGTLTSIAGSRRGSSPPTRSAASRLGSRPSASSRSRHAVPYSVASSARPGDRGRRRAARTPLGRSIFAIGAATRRRSSRASA